MKINKRNIDDFNLALMERSIQPPSIVTTKQSIPFMNGSYDFSKINGELYYSERELTCKFAIPTSTNELFNIVYSKLLNEIMTDNKIKIEFEDIPNFYFIGIVQNSPSFDEIATFGTCTVTFLCYPFKISTLQDGHDIWDEFNFELDMVQDTKFEVESIKNIQLYNNGVTGINPTVVCSSDMEVIKGNIIYKFKAGESKSWSFKLDKGLNDLIIKGTGTIEFKWYKEVL